MNGRPRYIRRFSMGLYKLSSNARDHVERCSSRFPHQEITAAYRGHAERVYTAFEKLELGRKFSSASGLFCTDRRSIQRRSRPALVWRIGDRYCSVELSLGSSDQLTRFALRLDRMRFSVAPPILPALMRLGLGLFGGTEQREHSRPCKPRCLNRL
jgi:hypothetical protein